MSLELFIHTYFFKRINFTVQIKNMCRKHMIDPKAYSKNKLSRIINEAIIFWTLFVFGFVIMLNWMAVRPGLKKSCWARWLDIWNTEYILYSLFPLGAGDV